MNRKKLRKFVAAFLAAVLFATCFSSSFSAFAADGATSLTTNYHDDSVSYNSLGWAELTDEQTATAVLDRLDELLAEVGPDLSTTLGQAIFGSSWDTQKRCYTLNVLSYKITIPLYLNSVDEIFETLTVIGKEIDDYHTLLGGDVKNIHLDAVYNIRRSTNTSVEVFEAVFQLLYNLSIYWDANNAATIVKQLLIGEFDLGSIIKGIAGGDLYELLQGSFYGIEDGYEENLVNNLLVFYVSQAFGDSYIAADNAKGKCTFSFVSEDGDALTLDEYLLGKLSTNLLQQINAEITYAGAVSSRDNYQAICEKMDEEGCTQTEAATALGLDAGLQYTESGNVYLFRYDSDKDGADDVNLTMDTSTTLAQLAYNALQAAWTTAIEPTFETLDVTVKGYDNDYHDWYVSSGKTWDYNEIANNYAAEDVAAWAAAREYDLGNIEAELTYDRSVIEEPTYTWQDINSNTLFNKLLYSPLMDYYFGGETGVLNLAVECTGLKNASAFFSESYSEYSSVINGVNDGLVAIMKDLFPNYTTENRALITTGDTSNVTTLTSALVQNAAALYQYAADGADANILSAFYNTYGSDAVVSEANFESSIIPFFISAIRNITMLKGVHDSAWNACTSFESIAAVCLREYLSYVLPDTDYSAYFTTDANGNYTTTLNDVVALSRDAVAYVLYQYVPLTDAAGNVWNIYDEAGAGLDATDIFDLLNSVINYYGNDKGMAKLLGFVDENGTSLITMDNSIWQNIDIIVNALLPVLGNLQYGNEANTAFNSEDLIYNTVIKGLFDIGENNGVSGIVSTLLGAVSTNEITVNSADVTVYSLLRDLVNGLFDARYTNQGYSGIVPAASSASPFNDLIQVDTLAGENGNDSDIGVIGQLICNLCEFTGAYGYDDMTITGMLYVLYAVNSFTGIIPQLSEFTLNEIEMAFDSDYVRNYTPGAASTSTLYVTNAAEGINRAVVDKAGNVQQLDRAFVELVSVESNTAGVAVSTGTLAGEIAPAETAGFDISTAISSSVFNGSTDCIVEYVVTYNLVDAEGNLYDDDYAGLTKTIYQYYTTDFDWYNATYASSEAGSADNPFTESFTPKSSAQAGTYSSMTAALASSLSWFTYTYMAAQLPNDVVIRTSELNSLEDKILLWVSNQTSSERGIDCVFAINGNDQESMAVSIDTVTGDIVNTYFHDYYFTTAGGDIGWVSEADLESTIADLDNAGTDYSITDKRFHVVCAHDDIYATYGSYTENKNDDGTYESIYITFSKTLGDEPETDINDVSLSTGIPGLIFGYQHTTLLSGNSQSYPFIVWDGETSLEETSVSLNIGVSANSPSYTTINIYVCEDEEMADLQNLYADSYAFISNYSAADFSDGQAYNYYIDALKAALAAMGTSINTDNAFDVSPTMAYLASTETTTDFYGDRAFVPLTSEDGAPTSITVNGTYHDGLYYQTAYTDSDGNAVFANPIYTNVPLTDNDVTETGEEIYNGEPYTVGEDAGGTAVVKIGEDWYLLNSVAYDTEWYDIDDSGEDVFYTTPYIRNTVQATNANGDALYDETTYVYRNADGVKVKSTDDWAYKLCETNYEAVMGEEYFSIYTAAYYKLLYANTIIYDYLNSIGAASLYTKVMAMRTNLNVNNFNSASYKKMVEAGREAEGMIATLDRYCTYSVDGEALFTCYESEAETELAEYNSAHNTGYVLSDLTATETDINAAKVTSSYSLFAINEAIRLFNEYVDYLLERGYLGTAFENEISCAASGKLSDATGVSYKDITVDTDNASYTVNGTTYTAENNPDGAVYSADSWEAFITALDAAVTAATEANSTYKYKDADYFELENSDLYIYQVTDLYTLKTALARAENNLSA